MGLISDLGEEPALKPVNFPLPKVFNNTSAITDRAEL
jgi:hypothetical protein